MNQEQRTGRLGRRTAIVTGASRGIGLGIARRLLQEGARVALTARGTDALTEAAAMLTAEVPEAEGRMITVAGKADDPVHRADVLRRVLAEFGRIDILALNAGINPAYGPTVEIDLGAARKILEVNVLAPLAWVQDAVAADRDGFACRGAVITVSSVTGLTPSPGIGMYGVSKAALAHLTRTLAAELGPAVRVNSVAPAVVKTQFAKALYDGKEAEVAAEYPAKRLGLPEDIAAAVAYLASDDASWVTGEVLTVDGGLEVAGGTA